jgi:hypothetical protein
MQISCTEQHSHIHTFSRADTFTQSANPERMFPIMTAPGGAKIRFCYFFDAADENIVFSRFSAFHTWLVINPDCSNL